MLCLPCWPACCLDKVCSLHSLLHTWPAAALPAVFAILNLLKNSHTECRSKSPQMSFSKDMQEERLALDSTLPFLENVAELFLEGSPASCPLGTSCFMAAACSCGMLVLSARTGSEGDRLRPICGHFHPPRTLRLCCLLSCWCRKEPLLFLATSHHRMSQKHGGRPLLCKVLFSYWAALQVRKVFLGRWGM